MVMKCDICITQLVLFIWHILAHTLTNASAAERFTASSTNTVFSSLWTLQFVYDSLVHIENKSKLNEQSLPSHWHYKIWRQKSASIKKITINYYDNFNFNISQYYRCFCNSPILPELNNCRLHYSRGEISVCNILRWRGWQGTCWFQIISLEILNHLRIKEIFQLLIELIEIFLEKNY
jgi:hypothetical protein